MLFLIRFCLGLGKVSSLDLEIGEIRLRSLDEGLR